MKKQGLLANPALTVPLALLAGCISMWSNNWNMYAWRHLGASLAVLLVLCSLIFIVTTVIHKRHRRGPASRSADLAAGVVICLLTVLAFFFIMIAPIQGFAFRTGLNVWLIAAAAVAGLCLLSYFGGFRTLNFFLILWLSSATVNGLYRVALYDGSYKQAVDLRLEMKTRPNIYLFVLESYHGLPVLEEVFEMDAGPMRTYLNDRGFFIQEPVMSNSPHTLGSFADMFTMQLSPIQPTGLVRDVMPEVRNAIGGNGDNALFRILKENGYYTVFLPGLRDPVYFFIVKGPYLDDTTANTLNLYVRPFYELNPYAFEFLYYMPAAKEKSIYEGSTLQQVKTAIEEGRRRGQPIFVSLKGGADHAPHSNYAGTPESFEKWKPEYREMVAGADKQIRRIVDHIVSVDPDSVIILIGDHGAQGYEGLFNHQFVAGDVDGFRRTMNEYDLSLQQVSDAFFNVLLAVRLPGGAAAGHLPRAADEPGQSFPPYLRPAQ